MEEWLDLKGRGANFPGFPFMLLSMDGDGESTTGENAGFPPMLSLITGREKFFLHQEAFRFSFL